MRCGWRRDKHGLARRRERHTPRLLLPACRWTRACIGGAVQKGVSMMRRTRELLIPLLLVSACMSDEVDPELEVAAVGSANGEVHGFVVAEVRGVEGGASSGRHYLPDATVFLRHPATGVASGHTTTDLKGFYQIKAHTFGIYDL